VGLGHHRLIGVLQRSGVPVCSSRMRRTRLSNPDSPLVNLVANLTISAAGVDGVAIVDAAAGGISFGNSDTHDSVSFLIGCL